MDDVILNGIDVKKEIEEEKPLEINVSDDIAIEEVSMKAEISTGIFVSDTITSRDRPHN